MRSRYLAALSVIGGPVAAYTLLARRWQLRWGTTDKESEEQLPGDDLIENADITATRAITIRASADQVWPWIAQLGQGRGGFYSYDFLETWSAATSTARIGSCPSGKTSRSATRSGSHRRSASPWHLSTRGARSFSVAGCRSGTPRPPTTPPGPSCHETSPVRRHVCSYASDTHTRDPGHGSSSSPPRC